MDMVVAGLRIHTTPRRQVLPPTPIGMRGLCTFSATVCTSWLPCCGGYMHGCTLDLPIPSHRYLKLKVHGVSNKMLDMPHTVLTIMLGRPSKLGLLAG